MMKKDHRSLASGCSVLALMLFAVAPAAAQDTARGGSVGDVGEVNEADFGRLVPSRPAYSPAVNRNFRCARCSATRTCTPPCRWMPAWPARG
ncbi:hypothetical protein [Albidovulum sp.]|uniref:hypothetical protein n=1 Tax=Albidovulum sp. TaxID=1872424 RepID=UPI0039B8F6D3